MTESGLQFDESILGNPPPWAPRPRGLSHRRVSILIPSELLDIRAGGLDFPTLYSYPRQRDEKGCLLPSPYTIPSMKAVKRFRGTISIFHVIDRGCDTSRFERDVHSIADL